MEIAIVEFKLEELRLLTQAKHGSDKKHIHPQY